MMTSSLSRGISAYSKVTGRNISLGMRLNSSAVFGNYRNNNYNNDNGSSSSSSSFQMMLPLAVGALVSGLYSTRKSESCGIVGVVGKDEVNGFLLEGLQILRNRGYDSAGLATVGSNLSEGELLISKFASRDTTADSIDLLRASSGRHLGHFTGDFLLIYNI